MEPIKNSGHILKKYPLFLVLLPLFFVLNGYNRYPGIISGKEASILFFVFLLASLVLAVLFYLLFRSISKAGLMAAVCMAAYLFFGAAMDFLLTNAASVARYKFMLPLLMILVLITFWWLRRKPVVSHRLMLLLNCLLLVYVGIDVITLARLAMLQAPSKAGETVKPGLLQVGGASRPDIYFLVFDEYSSSESLQKHYAFDNSRLDSFLVGAGFRIQRHSTSNYSSTAFSMASMLDMHYLERIPDPNAVTIRDYTNCEKQIISNTVTSSLTAAGYEILNYSIFDLQDNPSEAEISLLPVKTRLITGQTLFERVKNDIGWNLTSNGFFARLLLKKEVYRNLVTNNNVEQRVKASALSKHQRPVFVYAHFEMPHWPYYFNKEKEERSLPDIVADYHQEHTSSYTGYLPYVNDKLEEMVKLIKTQTRGKAVIMVMGDHGHRAVISGTSPRNFFENLNAVYIPGSDYRLWYDSISGVNQFRVLFNTLFETGLPLLKDTTIELRDKTSVTVPD